MTVSPSAVSDANSNPAASAPKDTAAPPLLKKAKGSAAAAALDNGLFFAFIALLAWTPLWFGSNRPFAWGVNAIGFGGLAFLYEIALLATRRRHPVALKRLWFPALAFLSVCAWSLLQTAAFLPLGYQHPIWQMAREALGRDLPGSISVARDETIIALLRFVTCGLAFWLALQLCRSASRARRLVQAIAIIGAVYAAYGIVAFYVFPRTTLWFDKLDYFESVTSSFVNRNSYATYAGIGLIASLAVCLSLYLNSAERSGAAASRKLAAVVSLTVGHGGLWIACAFVIGVALILTGSRGGVMATLGGLFAFMLLSAVRGRKNAAVAGSGLLLLLLALGAAFFNFGDYFSDRLTAQGLASDDRLAVYAATWRSIADAPLFGLGDGTFAEVFPIYRDKTLDIFGLWDKAHNSYLELLQGLGVPLALLFLAALLWLAGRCVYAALTRRNAATAPLAASAAAIIVCLHSFVDFSLQIEAVALTWAALLGAGTAQSWSGKLATDR